jgi:putative nucleotidyltransferase with HDIG domain
MSARAAQARASTGVPLARYLPLALLVTVAVTAVPLALVTLLGPARSPLAVSLHVLAAVAISIAMARVGAGVWTRYGKSSSDLVFGDLLLWGWARRALAERRLEQASRELVIEPADRADGVTHLQKLSALLEARDPYTHGHSRRVARHSERVARKMGLPRDAVARIRSAALVHDVGKINTPRAILTKPGKLTDAEFALVKLHAGDGARMVMELGDPELASIVRHHHERLDGTGYPDGLGGADIPIGARIIAVADTFDAITSTRPYRRPRTHKQAIDVLEAEAGTQLDEDAVAAFVSYYAGRKTIGWVAVLAAAPQRLVTGLGGVPQGIAASAAPIAQAACSVGGVALIGACIGGSVFPGSSPDGDDPAPAVAKRQAETRAQAAPTAVRSPTAPTDRQRARRRARLRAERPAEQRGRAEAVLPTRDVATPRALDPPPPRSPRGGTGSGSGGGLTEPPAVPDVRGLLPDPGEVLGPVTDQVLPEVRLPALPTPQLGLP